MYVPVIHDAALKNTQRDRRYGKSAESQKLKRARDYFDSVQKHHCGTIVERHFHDEQYHMRKHDQGFTRTDTVVQPNQGEGSNTVKTKGTP